MGCAVSNPNRYEESTSLETLGERLNADGATDKTRRFKATLVVNKNDDRGIITEEQLYENAQSIAKYTEYHRLILTNIVIEMEFIRRLALFTVHIVQVEKVSFANSQSMLSFFEFCNGKNVEFGKIRTTGLSLTLNAGFNQVAECFSLICLDLPVRSFKPELMIETFKLSERTPFSSVELHRVLKALSYSTTLKRLYIESDFAISGTFLAKLFKEKNVLRIYSIEIDLFACRNISLFNGVNKEGIALKRSPIHLIEQQEYFDSLNPSSSK